MAIWASRRKMGIGQEMRPYCALNFAKSLRGLQRFELTGGSRSEICCRLSLDTHSLPPEL
jgi:hypothetical protein